MSQFATRCPPGAVKGAHSAQHKESGGMAVQLVGQEDLNRIDIEYQKICYCRESF